MPFQTAIFNLLLLIGIFTSSKDNALRWMPWDLTDDKSTLVQVMALCRQATSNYLSQCWPSSMSPYGVTRPQWVNQLILVFSCQWNELSLVYITDPRYIVDKSLYPEIMICHCTWLINQYSIEVLLQLRYFQPRKVTRIYCIHCHCQLHWCYILVQYLSEHNLLVVRLQFQCLVLLNLFYICKRQLWFLVSLCSDEILFQVPT